MKNRDICQLCNAFTTGAVPVTLTDPKSTPTDRRRPRPQPCRKVLQTIAVLERGQGSGAPAIVVEKCLSYSRYLFLSGDGARVEALTCFYGRARSANNSSIVAVHAVKACGVERSIGDERLFVLTGFFVSRATLPSENEARNDHHVSGEMCGSGCLHLRQHGQNLCFCR